MPACLKLFNVRFFFFNITYKVYFYQLLDCFFATLFLVFTLLLGKPFQRNTSPNVIFPELFEPFGIQPI